jgi:hypothetical protein
MGGTSNEKLIIKKFAQIAVDIYVNNSYKTRINDIEHL